MCANGCILSDFKKSKFGRVSSIFACMTDLFTPSPIYYIVILQVQDHEMVVTAVVMQSMIRVS
jgi:phosphoenolpyruvate synthase/pyruvate phosphate dikinase